MRECDSRGCDPEQRAQEKTDARDALHKIELTITRTIE